jgi:hypothetical protein
VDGWRRQEIGISGGGSLRRPRPTQGCSAEEEEEEKKNEKEKNKEEEEEEKKKN